ncbi:MAG TPA: AAA domain-containing protein [Thermoanaerobaculia bacterium]|nr:AAA domain-containing protein [Thermoanaerobaculia bacterium]
MSPLSVAQFFKDSPIHFDLVVFDEASQIFAEDAIGATRRNQLVVAGDEKQLPPTSFFQASQVDDSDGDEEEDDDSTEQPDYESVLAACSTVLPQKRLGVIAFSNARLFESRLVTFPSAYDAESEMGVRWVPVPDGVYDRGKSPGES